MSQIPQIVAELLEPIPGDSPTGEDISDDGGDYDNVKASVTGNLPKYADGVKPAIAILKNESKDLQIASCLCVAWYHTDKMEGLKNGVQLLNALLDRYSGELFPGKKKQILALKKLNSKSILDVFPKDQITGDNAQAVVDLEQAFENLQQRIEKNFPDNGLSFDGFKASLGVHAKAASQFGVSSSNGQAASPPQPADDAATQVQGAQDQGTDSDAPDDAGQSATPDAGDDAAQEDARDKPGEDEIRISEEVANLLEPISDESPAGEEASNSTLFQEFQGLINDPIPNLSDCIDKATELFEEKTKDLRVGVRLCVTWFRKNSFAGLRDGLILLHELQKRFAETVHPQDEKARIKTISYVNSKGKSLPFIKRGEVSETNAEMVLEVEKAFQRLDEDCKERYGEKAPRLKDLGKCLKEHVETAQEFLKKKQQAQQRSAASQQTQARSQPSTQPQPTAASAKPAGGGTAQALSLASTNDSLFAIQKALTFMFEAVSEDNKKIRKTPEDKTWYGLSRQFKWGKLYALPPEKDGVTQIEQPAKGKQDFLNKAFAENNLDILISDIEARFIDHDSFKFWLDAQRLVVQALEGKGGKYVRAAEEIKFHLAWLLSRIPGIAKLKFKGGKTPFADEATLKWIDDEVKGLLGSGGDGALLPPLMGEEYDDINEMYQKAVEALPEKFEENLKAMQEAVAADLRKKGRFLRKARVADFCKEAKHYDLAKALLKELEETIEKEHLAEWEIALSESVWEAMYHVNFKILQTEPGDDEATQINREQRRLFEKISRYDAARALALAGLNHKEGE